MEWLLIFTFLVILAPDKPLNFWIYHSNYWISSHQCFKQHVPTNKPQCIVSIQGCVWSEQLLKQHILPLLFFSQHVNVLLGTLWFSAIFVFWFCNQKIYMSPCYYEQTITKHFTALWWMSLTEKMQLLTPKRRQNDNWIIFYLIWIINKCIKW